MVLCYLKYATDYMAIVDPETTQMCLEESYSVPERKGQRLV